jgi:hypothetical protein
MRSERLAYKSVLDLGFLNRYALEKPLCCHALSGTFTAVQQLLHRMQQLRLRQPVFDQQFITPAKG